MSVAKEMEMRLQDELSPHALEVVDDSETIGVIQGFKKAAKATLMCVSVQQLLRANHASCGTAQCMPH